MSETERAIRKMLAAFVAVYPNAQKPDAVMVRGYLAALSDLPAHIFSPAMLALVNRCKWFPSIADVRMEAVSQLGRERAAAASEARARIAACPACGGKGWIEITRGTVDRCACAEGLPPARLLPPVEDEEGRV